MNLQKMSKDELIAYVQELQAKLKEPDRLKGNYSLALSLQSSEILRKHFELSQKKNPAFSLRSFANKVGISPGKVSEILNGQYLMSIEMAERIVEKIGFEDHEKQSFLQAVQNENANLQELREFHRKMAEKNNLFTKKSLRHLEQEEEVHLLDHWQFYGIMTALEVKTNDHSVAGIASIMGMDESEVEERLRKMLHLKFVEEKEGKFSLVPRGNYNEGISTSPRASQIAAKKCSVSAFNYLSDRFSKTMYSESVSDAQQDVYFFLKAIDSSKVGKVPEFIAQSAYKSLEEMAQSENIDAIYMVNISFLKV